MIKEKKVILKMVFFALCLLIGGCGTIGKVGDEIDFPISKKKLEIAIDSLYSQYPDYKIPDKWKTFDGWSKSGYGFLENRIFYFKSSPEEMYYMTFIGDSVMLANPNKIGIALRAVYNGNTYGKWLLGSELDDKEKDRINKRFDHEIIAKLEQYTKTKASK